MFVGPIASRSLTLVYVMGAVLSNLSRSAYQSCDRREREKLSCILMSLFLQVLHCSGGKRILKTVVRKIPAKKSNGES